MLNLKRLGHILLKTADIEKSISFYRDILGFELTEYKSDGHEKMAFLSLGKKGHDIDLIEVAKDRMSTPELSRFHHVAFQVDSYEDLRNTYFKLVDQGIEIVRAMDHVNQKSIYIRDPEENIIGIYHELEDSLGMFRRGRDDNDTPLNFVR